MVWDLKIRDYRIAVFLNLHIFAVVLADRNAGIDDVRDGHHDLRDLLIKLCL